MTSYELAMARSGALDTDLLAQRQFYGTNFTKPLLFLEDGAYFGDLATAKHLQASQWGRRPRVLPVRRANAKLTIDA